MHETPLPFPLPLTSNADASCVSSSNTLASPLYASVPLEGLSSHITQNTALPIFTMNVNLTLPSSVIDASRSVNHHTQQRHNAYCAAVRNCMLDDLAVNREMCEQAPSSETVRRMEEQMKEQQLAGLTGGYRESDAGDRM